jgi:hypothetical protein
MPGVGLNEQSPGDPAIVTSTRPPAQLSAVPAPREQRPARDPWLRTDDQGVMTLPLAGQPGHGRTASLRRQPVRIVDGRIEGGYTGAFELICPSCGDHPYLDYPEVSSRLQWLRGPYPLEAGLTAYEKHLGLLPKPHDVRPGRSRPYDLEALTADVIDEAHRTHPFVARGEDRQASATFRPVDFADPFARPLPACPAAAAYLAFQPGGLDLCVPRISSTALTSRFALPAVWP